jgi:hypothetical protein
MTALLQPIEETLDRDGAAELLAESFDFGDRGGVRLTERLAGDRIISERDGCRYCLGCPVCEGAL